MKGLADRATVHNAALLAAEHWRAAFEERKAAWIKRVAERRRWFFSRQLIGEVAAAEIFEMSFWHDRYGVDGGSHGAFWIETGSLARAEKLVRLTGAVEIGQVILTAEEIATLHPGMTKTQGCEPGPYDSEPAQ